MKKIMKKQLKKLSLDEAAKRIVSLTEAYLDQLAGTSSPLKRANTESRDKSGGSHRTSQSSVAAQAPVAARASVSARGRR